MGNNGEVMKAFDIKDGYGLREILPTAGIIPIIVTGRKSRILEKRCEELDIVHLYQGINNKIERLDECLQHLCAEKPQCDYSNIVYCGDDINDLACMERIKVNGGLVGCPSDAVKEVKALADFE